MNGLVIQTHSPSLSCTINNKIKNIIPKSRDDRLYEPKVRTGMLIFVKEKKDIKP